MVYPDRLLQTHPSCAHPYEIVMNVIYNPKIIFHYSYRNYVRLLVRISDKRVHRNSYKVVGVLLIIVARLMSYVHRVHHRRLAERKRLRVRGDRRPWRKRSLRYRSWIGQRRRRRHEGPADVPQTLLLVRGGGRPFGHAAL